VIPGSASPFFLGSSLAAATAGGLQIERSLRFNSSDSGFLSRVPAVAGDRTTWTWSGWVKRSNFSGLRSTLFRVNYNGAIPETAISFAESAQGNAEGLLFGTYPSAVNLLTAAVFRDTSAWYHIVCTLDTTNGTSTDRARIYVNGTRITTFSGSPVYPSPSYQGGIGSTDTHRIGGSGNANEYFDGYLANVHFIDGQALDPSSFTETDATTGQLIPKTYTGSYGTNGFNLLFADNSSNTASTLGKDTSGLSNNFTPNNFSVTAGAAVSVAAASGALPVYNTTDTYGAVKGTGTRTDTNSASIVLAVGMDGTNGGTTFTDENATIKGSGSAKTITVTGNTNTSTTQSKFYGSSGYFDGTGDYLTVGSSADFAFGTGNFTVELWIYAPNVTNRQGLVAAGGGTGNSPIISIYGQSGVVGAVDLGIYGISNNVISAANSIKTNTWHHIAFVREGTGTNETKVYVDGVQQGQGTYSTNVTTNNNFFIGQNGTNGEYFTGYIQDLRIYKGAAKYTGNFTVPASPQQQATVAAGNDSLVDSPTNFGTDTGVGGTVRGNYCTANPLDNLATLSNGNLQITSPSTSYVNSRGTIAFPATDKWYAEATVISNTGPSSVVTFGLAKKSASLSSGYGTSSNIYALVVGSQFTIYNSTTVVIDVAGTLLAGDVMQIAYDATTGKGWVGVNNTWRNSTGGTTGNPSAGTNETFTLSSDQYFPFVGGYNNGLNANFGQRAFAYTAPSGFKALNTQNLPAPLVTKSNTVFDVALYTGNGGTQSITGLAFSPDLVWTKARSFAENNNVFDTVRGVTKLLLPDQSSTEQTISGITAFNSDGYTVGSHVSCNSNGQTYVAWAWDAGTSTVSNTQGSITSQVRANATAGFSVVTYTATAGTNTIGHGLGVAPSLIISKRRDSGENGYVYHTSLGSGSYLILNATNASAAASWGGAPTSTVFYNSTLTFLTNGGTYVAYCWAPVVGYSSFGSYTGNGSSDGPMVYTGFRPRWILTKRYDGGGNGWGIFDALRPGYNLTDSFLQAQSSGSESTGASAYSIDILSNGFKVKGTDAFVNQSAGTYIYAAFAEAPLNYSRAR